MDGHFLLHWIQIPLHSNFSASWLIHSWLSPLSPFHFFLSSSSSLFTHPPNSTSVSHTIWQEPSFGCSSIPSTFRLFYRFDVQQFFYYKRFCFRFISNFSIVPKDIIMLVDCFYDQSIIEVKKKTYNLSENYFFSVKTKREVLKYIIYSVVILFCQCKE